MGTWPTKYNLTSVNCLFDAQNRVQWMVNLAAGLKHACFAKLVHLYKEIKKSGLVCIGIYIKEPLSCFLLLAVSKG
jgi:hypothetical protein